MTEGSFFRKTSERVPKIAGTPLIFGDDATPAKNLSKLYDKEMLVD